MVYMDNTFEKERNSENISCWTHFYIRSVGDYNSDKGYVSKKEDTFDPDELTELLGAKPRNVWRYGEHVEGSRDPNRCHLASGWFSERVYEPPVNRFDHFRNMMQILIPHEKELIEFKRTHNVYYEIEMCIYEGSCSDILLESDVLAFCSRTGIEIRFNTVLLTCDPK